MKLLIIFTTPSIAGMVLGQLSACLTWKLDNSSLILTCKIPKLEFAVYFYNPAGKNFAYCVQPIPVPACVAFYKNTSVSQNVTSKETITTMKGKIDSRINGIWTCSHGAMERGSAEITVPELSVTETDIEKNNDIKWCWAVAICWNFLGCLISYTVLILFRKGLLPLLRKCAGESCFTNMGITLSTSITNRIKRITNVCSIFSIFSNNPEYRVKVFRRLVLILLLSLMVVIPLVAGLAREGRCTGHLFFVPFGSVFGMIMSIFYIEDKVPCNEKDNPATELDSFIMQDTVECIDTTLQKQSK